MVLEATRILEEKVVRDVRDVDLGLIFGVGFPPFKGGLLFWADTLGAAKIVEMLKPFEALGARMQADADAAGNGQDRPEVLRPDSQLHGSRADARYASCISTNDTRLPDERSRSC